MDLAIIEEAYIDIGNICIDPHVQKTINISVKLVKLPYILNPLQRMLLCSKDYIKIPIKTFGFVQLRSTFARLGLMAPPTIADPGFEGQITLEVFNASNNSIFIHPGEKIFSINFVKAYNEGIYKGRYQKQTGITLAKSIDKE